MFIILPIYKWNFELITPYFLRYLEKRFQSRVIRIFAATCFVLLTCLYLAIVVYAPSLALSQVTGLNINLSIVLTFSVCIFYTSIGGIKAVIWTNVFQVFLPIFLCTKFEWLQYNWLTTGEHFRFYLKWTHIFRHFACSRLALL